MGSREDRLGPPRTGRAGDGPWERRAPQGRLRGAHTYPQVVKPAVPHVVGRVEEPRVLAGDSREAHGGPTESTALLHGAFPELAHSSLEPSRRLGQTENTYTGIGEGGVVAGWKRRGKGVSSRAAPAPPPAPTLGESVSAAPGPSCALPAQAPHLPAPLLWTPGGGKGSEPRLGPGQTAHHSH